MLVNVVETGVRKSRKTVFGGSASWLFGKIDSLDSTMPERAVILYRP
jgi:hypothetical protein